jgi:inhibitor of cysteine peptidase
MPSATQVVDRTADGRDVTMSVGDTLVVHLDESPTTGYRWQVVHGGGPACRLADDHYQAPDDVVPGRSGVHTWSFRAEGAGTATIELAARRSWESGAPPARTFRVTVTVTR